MTTKPNSESAISDAEHAVMVARDVVAGLVERRRAVEQGAPARQAELDRISYLALVENNKAAQTRLAEIHALAGRHSSELAAIDAATAEAEHRLAEAEQDLEREVGRQQVADVLRHAAQIEAHGKKLDELVAEVLKVTTSLAGEHRSIVRLGCENPSTLTLHAMLQRAFESATLGSPLNREFIAGPARITFGGLGTNWRQMYLTWSKARLGALGGEEAEPVDIQEAAE